MIRDVTGLITNNMWTHGDLFPTTKITEETGFCEGFGKYHFTSIKGMHTQLGTYLETPAHYFGSKDQIHVSDVPMDKLFRINSIVLDVTPSQFSNTEKLMIRKQDLIDALGDHNINKGTCIAIATGWDQFWYDDSMFFPLSPYFTKDAMDWLIDFQPSIIASDTPSWENLADPQGFFPRFYESGILMLAPLANLSNPPEKHARFTILPLNIDKTAAAPCRVLAEF